MSIVARDAYNTNEASGNIGNVSEKGWGVLLFPSANDSQEQEHGIESFDTA